MAMLCLLVLIFCLQAAAGGEYVCYRDTVCSVEDPRPVFTVADSVEHCCGMPYILSAMEHDSFNCSSCDVTADRVSPAVVVLMPPEPLVLEVQATSYSAITWLYNGTIMHDYPRLVLEDYSKRLTLFNTSAEDAGGYEADIHLIGDQDGQIVTIPFSVIHATATTLPPTTTTEEPTEPSNELTVDAWPAREEVNIYQTNKVVTFLCEATNAEMVTWTTSAIQGQTLDDYCIESEGEAPLDTTQPPTGCTTPEPTSGDYDYTTDYEIPRTEVFLEPSPSPCVPDTLPPDTPQLTPDHCSVAVMSLNNETVPSIISMLVIDATFVQESLTFTCRAESNETMAEESVELVITETPYFLRRPRAPGGLVVSGYLELECSAIAATPPSITWHRVMDNQTIPLTTNEHIRIGEFDPQGNVTSSKLIIESVELTDAGVYVCEANSNNLVSQADTLVQIRAPATITMGPEDEQFTEGSTATLSCVSFGIPPPMIFWSRINSTGAAKLVDDLTRQNISMISTETDLTNDVTTSRLTISSVQLSDEGRYACNASNGIVPNDGSIVQYAEAYLTITPVMDISVVSNQSLQELMEGGTLYLECQTQGSPQISWLRNGQPLSLPDLESGKYTVVYEQGERQSAVSRLIVEGLIPGMDNDEGLYTCRVDNTSTARSVQVNIISIDNCVDGPCMNNGTCTDAIGQYICTCEPGFEGVNCSQLVEQTELPTIERPPQDKLDIEILESVMFTCTARGSPTPQYSWHKDGVFVRNTSMGDFILLEAKPQDRGFYTCTAHNQLGSSTVSDAGLLTLRGVYQYLVTFSSCNTSSLEETLQTMTISLTGLTLDPLSATIYSFTERQLINADAPPDNQVVITIVTSREYEPVSGSTADIQTALLDRLKTLTISHGCVFTDIRRYDGCPKTEYVLSKEVSVTWNEANIHHSFQQLCPCGKLGAQESRVLFRDCAGTFTYGAEWTDVDNECNFSNVTIELCDITTFDIDEQFNKLTLATQDIQSFNDFDISITSRIVSNLATSEEVLTNQQHQEDLVTTYDNLLKARKDVVTDSQRMFNSSSMLLESLDVFGLRIQLTDIPSLFTRDLITLQVTESPSSDFSGLSFAPLLNGSDLLHGANITVPRGVVEVLQSNSLRVLNTALQSDTLFVFNETERTVGDLFISATLPVRIQGLTEPVIVEFYLTEGMEERTEDATCVFWEQFPPGGGGYGRWSGEGCQLDSIQDGTIKCQCNHLTHFGVLLAIQEPMPSLPLEIITYIGIGVSLVCITVILITYICSKKLRRIVIGRLIINVCIPLGLFYVWFLLATQGRHYLSDTVDVVWFCYICSSLVQYFLLVYLCWTMVEVFHIYLKLVKVFGTNIHHFMLKAAVFAWGVPLVITAVCTGVGIHYGYWFVSGSDGGIFICYPTKYPLYGGVIAPFCLIYIFNITFFTVIMISLTRRLHRHSKIKGDLTKTNNLKELRKLLIIATCLSVLFGLGWVFGLTAQVPDLLVSIISQYIFSVLVGFQGGFIFILHGLRSTDVRKQWKRWLYKLLCCAQTPPDLLSTTSAPQSPTSGKTISHAPTTKFETDRHSHNPIYQSTDQLNGSYSPVHQKKLAEDKIMLMPPSPIKHSKEVDEHREAQTVEVSYAASHESSDEEVDFSDIKTVPFADGELGTAIGPDLGQHLDTQSLQLTEL